jgi:hypothetical protein
MVLGSSETRVIDMTRAFASVAARGERDALCHQQGDVPSMAM